jgi:MFS family permease
VRWPVLVALGGTQCVFWGIVYYAFSVLLVPMRTEWAVTDAAVAGAFSVGLAVSAALAPRFGRALDRGHGVALLRGGALAGAALLVAWSYASSVLALYVVWAGLGVCMAAVLYESVFALVARAVIDPSLRLRALAGITILGGLASTLFLPLVGWGVSAVGWRSTLQGLVVLWLIAAGIQERWALSELTATAQRPSPLSIERSALPATPWQLATPFVVTTFAGMAVTTLVVPMLVARGYAIEQAALVLAGLGIMQLPGRIWIGSARRAASATQLLLVPIVLQAIGTAVLSVAPSLSIAFVGVALFGVGAGLSTVARPWVVPLLYGSASVGRVNGSIARAQGVARAAGPLTTAALAQAAGAWAVFAGVALLVMLTLPAARATARRTALTRTAA